MSSEENKKKTKSEDAAGRKMKGSLLPIKINGQEQFGAKIEIYFRFFSFVFFWKCVCQTDFSFDGHVQNPEF